MSRQTIAALESQISSTRHELELATFLNKGILQTNTEYKLRIAELESENGILRKAESRLSRTEDRLEDAEKQLRKLEGEKDDWEAERESNLEERESMQKEKLEWENRYWSLKGKVESVLRAEEMIKKGGKNVNPEASTSTSMARASTSGPGRAKVKRDDHLTPATKARSTPVSSKRPSRGGPSTSKQAQSQRQQPEPLHEAGGSRVSLSPIRPPNRAQSKKRRRVEDSSGEDEVDRSDGDVGDADGDEREVSDPLGGSYPYHQTPPRTQTPRRVQPATSAKKRVSTKKREPRPKVPVVEVKVKNEPTSPGWESEDDDDDPLAML